MGTEYEWFKNKYKSTKEGRWGKRSRKAASSL